MISILEGSTGPRARLVTQKGWGAWNFTAFGGEKVVKIRNVLLSHVEQLT